MPTVVQFRRGTTTQNNNFLGASGEISVDTTLNVLRVADGITTGGYALVGQNCVQTIANKIYQGTSVSVTGDITAAGNINGANINSTNADLAELYIADISYNPGAVVEFGGQKEITITTNSHSTAVAGIVSTAPGHLMNSELTGEHVVAVALTGRVPCQVFGTIQKGDRLVSSNIPGVATVLDSNQYQPGCIIGKALETYDSETIGTIEVAVGRT